MPCPPGRSGPASCSLVEFGRLGETSVGAMVGDMLAMRRPPLGLVQFLARAAEGNPFFVAEYLRTAVAEGILHRRAGAWLLAGTAEGAAEATRCEASPPPTPASKRGRHRSRGQSWS